MRRRISAEDVLARVDVGRARTTSVLAELGMIGLSLGAVLLVATVGSLLLERTSLGSEPTGSR